MNILLVEDSPTDRMVLHNRLRRAFPNLRFWVAGEAYQFAEYLMADHCDVAVTDYWLGWSDGLSVLQRVRERWPRSKVIMLTGNGSEEIVAEALRHGLFQYLLKPYGYEDLVRVTRTALEARRYEEQHALLDSIFGSIVDGVFSVDTSGTITSWNRAAEEIFGHPASEIVGQRLDVLLPPGLRDETGKLHQVVLGGATIPELDVVRLRRDGSAAHLTITLTPIRSNGAGIIGIVCVARARHPGRAAALEIPSELHTDQVRH
jgi:PAS domain S-box-containing protein